MRGIQRIISVFLTLCLLSSLFPAQVIAVDGTPLASQTAAGATQTDVISTGFLSTGVQYNPLYDAPLVSGSSQKYYSGTGTVSIDDEDYLTSAEEAAAVLRAGMVQRTADMIVNYRVDAAQCDGSENSIVAIANEIFELALAHTGISTEGDALRWVYESFNADISYGFTDEYYYFSYTFHMVYYTTAEQEAALTQQVDQILSGFGFDENTSDYTKIQTIYDYICDNVVYDYDNLNDASYKLKHTAYAALIDGTAVCQGYALLLYRMLLDVGVDCRVITGIGGGDNHAWNIIKVDGAYYNADSTWDAGTTQYGYFLVCDANFPDHTREDSYTTETFHAAYPMGAADYDPNEASGGESGKVAFGTCGNNLTWVLDEEGVLTISGEGDMTSNPWNDYNDLIQTVVIKDGVTSLISCAFSGCLALKEVVLPNTLSSTGVSTFNGCVSLKNIHIPSEVEHIGIGAFLGCTSLETVSFSGELKTIGTDAFRDCVSLKRMDIPLSVQVIGDTSFYGCTGLECVSIVAAKIGDWVFADCTSLQEVDLGDDITSIGMGAFAKCSALENMQLPAALLHLERDVFSECASLTSIEIPKGVTDIGESAFFACRSLQTIALPDGLETIGACAFQYTAIESLIIPSNVSRIENGTFYGSSIKTLTLGENVKHVGNAFTFSDLESLHLPASVESIDTSSWGLSAMRTISVDEDNPYFKAIDGVLYNKDGTELICCPPQRSGEFVIPNTVVKLCDRAFYGCENITGITIPATVTFYGDDLFADCHNLTRVILCEGITIIPNGLFRFCTNLETVSIPESVTHIGDNAFLGCESLQSFNITKNIQVIGTDAFAGCTYTYFSTDPDNQSYVIENGVIYTKDMRVLVYATKSAPKELVIPDGVEIISSESLHNAEAAISTIVFPDSVEQIGNQACLGMTELKEVEFGSNLTSIGQSAFSSCYALREIVIPNTKPLCIGDSAFKECYALESVVVTGSVDEIGTDAFSYCNALKTINIQTITSRCGAYAFSDTAYYGNEENWRNGGLYVSGWLVAAFVEADGHFIIEEGTCGIAQYVFLDNLNLIEVTIPGSVQIINDCAFQGCRALKQVKLEFGLERIEELAFMGCEVLEELVLPASVKYLGSEFWALGLYNRVKFVGCAPYFHENAFGNMGPTAVYYPANDATWTQHIGKQFGAPTLQLRDNDGYVIEEIDGITWCEYIRNICTEHTYNQVVTPPTHTEQGYTTHTCTICGDSFVDSYVDALDYTAYDLASSIAALPEVSDPMGTEYYFYNQLNDVEKAIYWMITKATWATPRIIITGVSSYTDDELYRMAQRALTAVLADSPEYHMQWGRYLESTLRSEDSFRFYLSEIPGGSEYKLRKAEARIDQIVATVGMEGDLYSRIRDLLELLHQEMDYDFYMPFCTEVKINLNDSALSCLLYNDSVCAGFSDTVKILCDKLQIPCITVGNAGHAWNFVRMEDGKWYSIDASTDTPFEWEYNLIGQNSERYIDNVNWHLSNLYLGNDWENFSFPTLADDAYVYSGNYEATYHSHFHTFVEPEPTFVYTINPDGTTCTIIEYQGEQVGDLIIPATIDGYTVTAIGESAFYHATGFTGNLIIADTVTVIGDGAFQECSGLTGTLHLSENLTFIGAYAFLGNQHMSGGLSLPDTLVNISRCAFYDCSSLTGTLSIPAGVNLGDGVFTFCRGFTGAFYLPDDTLWNKQILAGTNIDEVQISNTNQMYTTVDGLLYSKDMKTLWACPPGRSAPVSIADGVETIANGAFYYINNLISIVIPKTVTTIEDWGLSHISNLDHLLYTGTESEWSSIDFSANNVFYEYPTIHYQAVGNEFSILDHGTCSVDKIYICTLCENPKLLLTEPSHQYVNGACSLCGVEECWVYRISEDGHVTITSYTGAATSIVIPDTIEKFPVTAIGAGAFYGASTLQSISIPEGVTSIGNGAFLDCIYLKSVTLPKGLTSIGASSFNGCTSLESIVIPESVTSIGEYAFLYCSALESVVLPDSITSIGTAAFQSCTALKSIHVPRSLNSIASYSFFYCTSLTSINIPDSITLIDEFAFQFTGLTSVTIPSTVTDINDSAFANCTDLTEIVFDGNCPNMAENVFFGVTATCRYPFGNTAWAEGITQHYGGTITWQPYCVSGCVYDSGMITIAPTCVDTGAMTYTCSVCGGAKTQVIPATGEHIYDEGLVTSQPTCVDEGSVLYTCSVCDYFYTETVPTTDNHCYDSFVTTGPTCIEDGNITHICIRCNHSYTESIPATGEHNYDEGMVTSQPTCVDEGVKTYSCTTPGCGHTKTEMVEAIGRHTWKSAAAVQPGVEQKVCVGCAAVMRIPLSGWVSFNGTWYHCTQPGVVDIGWHFVDGQLYYFSTGGAIVTGWQQIDGARYYFDSSGALVVPGSQYTGGTWFYPDASGEMVPGWKQLDDTWYCFNESGYLVPAWRQLRGTWYYRTDSGTWMPCWKEIGGTWYYYNRSDAAEPYWQRVGGFWDCLHSSGVGDLC